MRLTDERFAERFWTRVLKTDGCWLWQRARDPRGYGAVAVHDGPGRAKIKRAHRVAYQLATGEMPGALFVCHRCDNPPCVRPDHLFLGTHAQNTADAMTKGRIRSGERHGMARLSAEQVVEARTLSDAGVRPCLIARRLGVTKGCIYFILKGQRWAPRTA